MNENVIKVLNENLWDVVTMGEIPDVAPVAFKAVLSENKLAVGDVFLTKTLENIANNGLVIISAFNGATLEGYKVQGKAKYVTEGEVVETLAKAVADFSNGALKLKGALLIDVEKVFATTPGSSKEAL